MIVIAVGAAAGKSVPPFQNPQGEYVCRKGNGIETADGNEPRAHLLQRQNKYGCHIEVEVPEEEYQPHPLEGAPPVFILPDEQSSLVEKNFHEKVNAKEPADDRVESHHRHGGGHRK